MKIKTSVGEKIFDICNILFMLFMVAITLYPVLYVVFAAFSDPFEFNFHTGLLFHPISFSFESMKAVFDNPDILIGYKNTIMIVLMGVIINIIMTIIGGYFLSRKGLMLRVPITVLIIFTMYFHGGLIPSYLLISGLGMKGTFWALTVPTAISTFNLMIMRTGFYAIPDSLEESAKLDGASHLTILFRIMVPLAMPTIAVLLLYYGVAHWNSWFPASIYLDGKRTKYPLQLFLREILTLSDTRSMTAGSDDAEMAFLALTIRYATIIVATVPVLCVYPFLQKYFTKGIMVGAVKG